MSDFEFLSVLISIVIGFGLTHLLSGLGRAFYFRNQNKMDAVHVAWTITVFFVLVLNWWVLLLWRDVHHWNFVVFFTVIMWVTTMYVLALALYPPNLSGQVDYGELFVRNRNWFLSTWVIMCLLDLITTSERDQALPELFYFAFVGHYALIAFLGIFVRHRLYDLLAAWYIMLTMAAWSFGVRFTLF